MTRICDPSGWISSRSLPSSWMSSMLALAARVTRLFASGMITLIPGALLEPALPDDGEPAGSEPVSACAIKIASTPLSASAFSIMVSEFSMPRSSIMTGLLKLNLPTLNHLVFRQQIL